MINIITTTETPYLEVDVLVGKLLGTKRYQTIGNNKKKDKIITKQYTTYYINLPMEIIYMLLNEHEINYGSIDQEKYLLENYKDFPILLIPLSEPNAFVFDIYTVNTPNNSIKCNLVKIVNANCLFRIHLPIKKLFNDFIPATAVFNIDMTSKVIKRDNILNRCVLRFL